MLKVIDVILDAIYPKRCGSCDEITLEGSSLCDKCLGKLERVITPICITCGNSLRECECDTFIYHFDGVVAPFKNKGVAKDMVYNFKFNKNYSSVDYIVKNMAESVLNNYKDLKFDFICFVPKKKGDFNQCEILAKQLSKVLRIPVRTNMIIKIKDNQVQHNLPLIQRFDNVKEAYRATVKIKGKTVLLLDDIKTTGATLNECARELKFAGANEVYCVTALIR